MNDIKAVPGELRATIHVTHKATGKTEQYEIVGHADPAVLEKILNEKKEKDRERNP